MVQCGSIIHLLWWFGPPAVCRITWWCMLGLLVPPQLDSQAYPWIRPWSNIKTPSELTTKKKRNYFRKSWNTQRQERSPIYSPPSSSDAPSTPSTNQDKWCHLIGESTPHLYTTNLSSPSILTPEEAWMFPACAMTDRMYHAHWYALLQYLRRNHVYPFNYFHSSSFHSASVSRGTCAELPPLGCCISLWANYSLLWKYLCRLKIIAT